MGRSAPWAVPCVPRRRRFRRPLPLLPTSLVAVAVAAAVLCCGQSVPSAASAFILSRPPTGPDAASAARGSTTAGRAPPPSSSLPSPSGAKSFSVLTTSLRHRRAERSSEWPGGTGGGFRRAGRRRSAASASRETLRNGSALRLSDRPDDEESKSEEEEEDLSKALRSKLTQEFFGIGVPAFVQLAAEPLAALVDTAYLGRLGPEVLGGAGVAISAQYAVSKLYNDPLLRTSISLVASQDGKARGDASTAKNGEADDEEDAAAKELSIAVSSALLLALSVGVIQLVIYSVFCTGIVRGMGLDALSPMWHSAVSYLRIRALGTPAATLWLVTNGVFRGLGDTRTPLKYSLVFTALNAILDPFFIFTLNFGASGAAAGTAIAQYVALVPLLRALNRRVKVDFVGQIKSLGVTLREYLKAGGYVLFRTLGKVLAYSVCARKAAMLGSVSAAAYNLTFQLGFATTQICEAVAVAVQTLLARELADSKSRTPKARAEAVRFLIDGSIAVGGAVAGVLSLTTYLQRDSVLRGLTSNEAVREASRAIFPAVMATQFMKGLAYPVNGIIMGGLDWRFTMIAMWAANAVCVGMVKFGDGVVTLNRIWWALAAFMGTQVVTGVLRFQSKTGVWRALKPEADVE